MGPEVEGCPAKGVRVEEQGEALFPKVTYLLMLRDAQSEK